jgi:hypothetical protein
MGTAPIIGVAAVAATVGILVLLLLNVGHEIWLATPAWAKFGIACFIAIVSIILATSTLGGLR